MRNANGITAVVSPGLSIAVNNVAIANAPIANRLVLDHGIGSGGFPLMKTLGEYMFNALTMTAW